ncbi:MAG: hypothetical protein SFY32_13345 [Bacteroidota bacterium]|nr:hypothetical protein [Bacteroidota bacterium]
MGHIKEPKGVDFIINSEPLTDKHRLEISEYIRNYKSSVVKPESTLIKSAKKKRTKSLQS